MKILAIETSCDETAAAVVADGRYILGSRVATQIETHSRYGGVVPEIASRAHTEALAPVTAAALEEAGIDLLDIDAVAVTCAPGLIGALISGVSFAKGLALALGVPLIPAHHIRGHIASAYLAFERLEPPFLAIAVSGGHTAFIHVSDYISFRTVGRSRDDAAGEAFDKVGRVLGMPYPAGAAMDAAASGGDPAAYHFPRPLSGGGELDMSFSGLKTAALNIINTEKLRGAEINIPDFAASFTAAVVEVLTSRAERALRLCGERKLALVGGVAANSHLKAALGSVCADIDAELFVPPPSLCGDNAAMIAAQSYYEFKAGRRAGMGLNPRAAMSADDF